MNSYLFTKRDRNYKGLFFILGFHLKLEKFLVGIIKGNDIVHIGSFSKGISEDEKSILIQAIEANKKSMDDNLITVEPGICIELEFQIIVNAQLKNVKFLSFQLQQVWKECTWDGLLLNNLSLEQELTLTSPEKVIWKSPYINKESYLSYLAQIATYMLPFLKNRLLTTIRFPNGIEGESFFQKNCPDYAPNFIKTKELEGNHFIICNDLSTLLWLGNQLAIEYHIPFQTYEAENPIEIVFDLDPPNTEAFSLAIKAALELKIIFDSFQIKSYPKVSGSKGIQIHIPIKENSLTYDDTRVFTSFIAHYLIEKFPDDFTIERLKKNRGNRLYIDYVQHAKGKTIICPYSTRGKEKPTVATPLIWAEVNDELKIETFTIPFVLNRLENSSCPMDDYFEQDNISLVNLISTIKESQSK
ncbi:DNA ligase D [Bacillus sp. AFS041924]|uniref:DNA ligase D n=1 Tax=Bacillus sp. AFS041924 TaxID=2033503 RepID=UPI000BFE20FC|nr:DNA ligase D [Bacillus sp. AFS041924]PGS56371.1 DNA ligase D [Bacillus sp. AFS041924]